jgi:hypothetical protein
MNFSDSFAYRREKEVYFKSSFQDAKQALIAKTVFRISAPNLVPFYPSRNLTVNL